MTYNDGMDTTLEEKGAKRVSIFTGRDSDGKRMGTFQVYCFCLPKELSRFQPRLGIIFRGKGGSTTTPSASGTTPTSS